MLIKWLIQCYLCLNVYRFSVSVEQAPGDQCYD